MADQLHYSPSLKNAPLSKGASPSFKSDAQWHRNAITDTGTSHCRVGRPYIVSCAWCSAAFAASTAAEAMEMFREHEEEMTRG